MRFLLAAFIAAVPSYACSRTCPPTEVGRYFRVKVENQGKPVKGLRVIVTGERTMSAETDENGFAFFARVPPGSYGVRAAQDAGFGYGCLLVKLDHSFEESLPYSWPTKAPISVKSVRGSLYSSNYRPPQPYGNQSIDLLEGISGRLLKTVRTNKAGEFDFEYSVPGVYFIRIKSPIDSETDLSAVTVSPQAPTDHLELAIVWTSCGLEYVDQSNCPRLKISAPLLFGNLVGASGIGVDKGIIWLLDNDGKLVEELRSDDDGSFTSSVTSPGSYHLIAGQMTGVAPLRATIQLDPSAPYAAFKLRVGGLSGCSTASQ